MSNKTKSDTFGSQWIEWAKEEIIALSKIVQEKNAEIERLRDKVKELEESRLRTIRCVDAEQERGARILAKYIVMKTEHPRFSVEDLMTIWKRLK